MHPSKIIQRAPHIKCICPWCLRHFKKTGIKSIPQFLRETGRFGPESILSNFKIKSIPQFLSGKILLKNVTLQIFYFCFSKLTDKMFPHVE